MTTIEVSVASGPDDAGERQDGSGFSSSSNTIRIRTTTSVGSRTSGGFRFPGVTIPAGATINVAYVIFSLGNAIRNDPNLRVYFEAVANAQNYSDNPDVIDRLLTTAFVNWEATDVAANAGNTFQTPSLVAPLQEVIDLPAWASGNALNLLLIANNAASGDLEVYAYENGVGAVVATLHVEYTESGGSTDKLPIPVLMPKRSVPTRQLRI